MSETTRETTTEPTPEATDERTATVGVPYFPAPAPAVFGDATIVSRWFASTFAALGPVADRAAAGDLAAPTTCADYHVADLLDHVLGWCDFFGRAFADPRRSTDRPDPAAYRMAVDRRSPAQLVAAAGAHLQAALAAGVLRDRVVLSEAEMDGPAAAAMVLGEYLIHGWDLAGAAGQPWSPEPDACEAARAFFEGIITPEYRGPEGFFAAEVPVPVDAPPLARLLGYAGRDPFSDRGPAGRG